MQENQNMLEIDNGKINNGKKKTVKNYFYNLSYQIFLLIVPLAVTPYISRVLLPEGVGQYSFAFSVISYFILLASFGFDYYAQRIIAKNRNDNVKKITTFWEILICRSIPVTISFLINLILCFAGIYGDYTNLMLILSFNIFSILFDIAFYFQGCEMFGKLAIRNFIIKSISIISIFLFVKDSDDLFVYTFINSATVLISNISMWITMPREIVKIKYSLLRPFKHLKGTLVLFIPTIAISLYTVLDKTFIGLLINDTYTVFVEKVIDGQIILVEEVRKYSDLENGYYEQSEKLVKMVMTVITSIGTIMIPKNSNEFAKGNKDNVIRNVYMSGRIVMLLGIPLVLGFILIADNFVPWYFGEGYDKCKLLIKIFSPLILLIGFSNLLGNQFLIPTGQDKKFTVAVCLGALINVSLNIFFIQNWWSYGAAIASIIAELFVMMIMAFMVRKDINLFKILFSGIKYVISGFIMFILCFYITNNWNSSIMNTICIIIFGLTIYIISLLILKDKFIYDIIKNIFKKLRRSNS